MSRTTAGARLTMAHRQQLLAVRAALIKDLAIIWGVWEVGNDDTYGHLLTLLSTLVRSRNRQASALASKYYELFRQVEGVAGAATPVLAATVPAAKVLESAHSTGRAGVFVGLKAGMTLDEARANGFVRLTASMGRHVLNGSRETLVQSVQSDPQAIGWARVTSFKPCAFCAMLASRGPVYKEQTVGFVAHDACSCSAEPVYSGSKWPGRASEFRDLWNKSTRGASGKDAINAFRSSFE